MVQGRSASNGVMAVRDLRTGFEWMDTTFLWTLSPYNFTRLLVTLWGAFGILGFARDAIIYIEGPPDLGSHFMPIYRCGLTFYWLDYNPTSGFLLSLILWIPSIC